MPWIINRRIVALLLVACLCADAAVYFPPSCERQCTNADFIEELPVETGPKDYGHNRAYAWAMLSLIQVNLNLGSLSPPGVGRICAIVGTCLHRAARLCRQRTYRNGGWEIGYKECGYKTDANVQALDGAGYWVLKTIFGEEPSFRRVFEHYHAFSGSKLEDVIDRIENPVHPKYPVFKGKRVRYAYPIDKISAYAAGAAACQAVIDEYTADGFSAAGNLIGNQDPTGYTSVNSPQKLAGITDCDNEIVDYNRWQPLCIPSSSYDFGTPRCKPQTFLAPWAGRYTTFALEEGDDQTGYDIVPLPPVFGSPEMTEQWKEVLEYSSKLDDVQKIIAEYWADGPDSTFPPGHSFKIAADSAIAEGLSTTETAKLLFIVGNAVNDAGIASWRTKTSHDLVRPLQLIQCSLRGEMHHAWKGPYQGTGMVNASEWRPYQSSSFVTPPFAAYTSGHSTFSAAAAEAMRLFFGSDRYRGPSCNIVREGESLFEPKSDEIPGVTDIPNTGPESVGYVPGQDVVLCWETYTDAADQAGVSRLMGGIHIKADDEAGRVLGRSIGRAVYLKAKASY